MTNIIDVTDDTFESEITGQDKPVLAYFYDPDQEVCEFMDLVVKEVAAVQGDDLKIVTLDGIKNPDVVDAFSIPLPPVFMVFRDDTILGYQIGKMSTEEMTGWLGRSLAKTKEDGVSLDEFHKTLEERTFRQTQNQFARLRAARKKSFLANGVNILGGAAIALTFPVTGFGALGVGIIAYHLWKSAELALDKTKEPNPAKSVGGKIAEMGGNLLTVAGSFGLVAAAFTMATPLAVAGVAAGSFMLLNGGLRFGHRLGQFLPLDKLLIGGMKEMAKERANHDPDRPLDEFTPERSIITNEPTPKRTPSPDGAAVKNEFGARSSGKEKAATVIPVKPPEDKPGPK